MNKKKILLIDDDPLILDALYNLLSTEDSFTLQKTSQGEEGMSLIHDFKPDLVILDIMLPEMDGFEICKRIRTLREGSRPKVVLLSALSSLLDRMESNWLEKTGALALFPKPLDFPVFLNQINRLF